ncbi:MAG: HNH endonuclease [Planctomycetes bacterium]|nr:HNH endonuclease [Planctomycetota bacterium]
MSIPAGTREHIRQRAGSACEFCGITETDAGGPLTLDHFQPLARGGSDDPGNLIYCCVRCNQYKHDYSAAPLALRRDACSHLLPAHVHHQLAARPRPPLASGRTPGRQGEEAPGAPQDP